MAEVRALLFDNSAVRIHYGKAVWEGGQLERELREGSWLLATATAESLLPEPPLFDATDIHDGPHPTAEELFAQSSYWGHMLQAMGPSFEPLSRYAWRMRPKAENKEDDEDDDDHMKKD